MPNGSVYKLFCRTCVCCNAYSFCLPVESDSNTAASAGAEDLFMGKDDSFLNDLLMDVAQMDQMEGLGYMPVGIQPISLLSMELTSRLVKY